MADSHAPLVEPRSFGLTFAPPSITLVYALDRKLRERARATTRPARHVGCGASGLVLNANPALCQASGQCRCGACGPTQTPRRWRYT